MEARSYHINVQTGEPNRCREPAKCPLGEKTQHYSCVESAKESLDWTYLVRPPKRGVSRESLSSIKSYFRRAAIDNVTSSDESLHYSWRTALKHFDGLCYLCGKSVYNRKTGQEIGTGDLKASADHIIPYSAGGTSAPGNIAAAHAGCNNSRGDTPLEEYLADNQEMLNRVKNFQKKHNYKPLTVEQLASINATLDVIWVGIQAQINAIKDTL